MRGMGFRNLINFNRALLTQQVWRLIKNPGSLAAKVLKHLYFCSCSVLEAEDGRKGSFLWHSLCLGRGLIDAGSRWRIGCGSGVSIYNDKWILHPNSFRVVFSIVRDDIVFVSQLKTESGAWNVPLIRHLFLEVDAYVIFSIPTSATHVVDTLCWHYTADGNYSVKSGYKLGNESEYLNRASSSGSGLLESWWKTLWHLEIHTKVKVFIWRACRHWIPTRQCLAARHIPVEGVCPICLRDSETVLHALWGYKRLKTEPVACVFMEKTSFANGLHFLDFILGFFKCLSKGELSLLCIVFWPIWFVRNQWVHGERENMAETVLSWSINFLLGFQDANGVCSDKAVSAGSANSPGSVISNGYTDAKWIPPLGELFKINTDAALDMENNIVAVVESDAKGVVELINSGRKNYSKIGLGCLDITDRLRDGSISGIQFVARAANNVAHTLAKLALSVDHDRFWVESYPDCVSHRIQKDLPC
ncbi:hypothetical protein Ddye_011018 [Dipteronia dyeriana]|uniref:Reverse transcriptase zinc-binding domain-containing protein n=1 Tax=Dipteronia dyeriana TaxID=168575 RepID=A0AAD9XEZ5_9ROSI|nr:hypothetical protein Ddye_011018 [Dipteronia dyeriana]